MIDGENLLALIALGDMVKLIDGLAHSSKLFPCNTSMGQI
jgi:hypothetical protein